MVENPGKEKALLEPGGPGLAGSPWDESERSCSTYPLVNKHRPWKSPIINGNIWKLIFRFLSGRVELLIYQGVIQTESLRLETYSHTLEISGDVWNVKLVSSNIRGPQESQGRFFYMKNSPAMEYLQLGVSPYQPPGMRIKATSSTKDRGTEHVWSTSIFCGVTLRHPNKGII